MKYDVVIVFRQKGLNEQYNYKYTRKFIISDLLKLNKIIEDTNSYYTVISIEINLIEEDYSHEI